MERLTRKVGKEYISTKIDYFEFITVDDREWNEFIKVIEKLGKLEDLEEKIGLPIEFILNEIIGKNIYYLYESNYREDRVGCEIAAGLIRERYPFSSKLGDWQIETGCYLTFEISDFRKTWWLSEEEAERKLEEISNE